MGDLTQGTASIGAAPRGNIGPSFRVIRYDGATAFKVVSSPYPLHWAMVVKTHITPGWIVSVETASVTPKRFGRLELREALYHGGLLVGALYRVDMRRKFTGPQRYAMGRNLCPAKTPCELGAECPRVTGVTRDSHYHLCHGVPDGPNTVWCEWHAANTEYPGQAFRAIDDASGGD